MIAISAAQRRTDAAPTPAAPLPQAGDHPQRWALSAAEAGDVAAVKALFLELHTFNAALDPRFALAEDWECHFDAMIAAAIHAREALCLLVCEQGSRRIAGFVLAAIHRDSNMWRYRDWVEVEALYVADELRGQGWGAALLEGACAWAEAVGRPVVQLYVTASNRHALDFYQHQGFREAQAILRKVPA